MVMYELCRTEDSLMKLSDDIVTPNYSSFGNATPNGFNVSKFCMFLQLVNMASGFNEYNVS